ncbi:13023_t:CDS:2, partial [Ambispora gerdemannii]
FPTTASSNFLTNFHPDQDTTVIKSLTKKPVTLLGKTVLDELACGGTGLYANTGPIFNPYNSACLVGGSSSGSAVVVANNLATFALGSDTGGSVRQPAAYCGIVGFKPSYGLISRFGLIPMASSLDTVGILANSVITIQKIFPRLAQPDPADLLTMARQFDPANPSPPNKKVVIIKGIENYLSPSFVQLYRQTLTILQKKGIIYGKRASQQSISHLRTDCLGKVVRERLLIGAYFCQDKAMREQAYHFRHQVKKWTEKVFQHSDFLLFPSTNSEAPPINQASFISLGSKNHWSDNLLLLANLAGLPSLKSTQQELITLKGRLKMGVLSKVRPDNNDKYYYVPMEIIEAEKNGQKTDNRMDSVMLIFWEKDFVETEKMLEIIANLKENQIITAHGRFRGQDNGLLIVRELETEENESDIF